MINYILPIFLATLVGYLTQRTGLCMVRGVHELLAKRPAFLITILCCGFWYWLVTPFSTDQLLDLSIDRYQISFHFILGGFMFGFGAAINKGCSISTISKLAKGHYHMLLTVMGWLIGWFTLTSMSLNLEYNKIQATTSPSLLHLALLLIVGFILFYRVNSAKRPLLLGIIFFGITASILTYLVPNWSPSQLLKDISAATLHMQEGKWPSIQRFLIITGLIVGMAAGAKKRLSITQFEIRFNQLVTHLIAGIIMGVGASLALGGNDSQLLIALPAISPAGAITVLFIVLGIASGMMLRKWLNRDTPSK
ncbi:YeeE/YedE family protein [Photobacterium makurazakiensis]|uniref:YeeE/YedE thiosulfate transporter family protein n=1 Tax=Photobacterium makurazakiensis TaxID=2910234 RepID=UPI003D0E1CB0